MKTDRVLAIVRSLIQRQADEIAMLTNPSIHWNMEDRLLDLARLKAILVQQRLIEVERELVKIRGNQLKSDLKEKHLKKPA
jgi:hypothetical protein